jgi:hypothetical protein
MRLNQGCLEEHAACSLRLTELDECMGSAVPGAKLCTWPATSDGFSLNKRHVRERGSISYRKSQSLPSDLPPKPQIPPTIPCCVHFELSIRSRNRYERKYSTLRWPSRPGPPDRSPFLTRRQFCDEHRVRCIIVSFKFMTEGCIFSEASPTMHQFHAQRRSLP